MVVFPRWSTALFAFAMTAAAAAYAQDRDPPRPPPHDPAFEAAMDDCWVDYGGEPDDPIPADTMAECMASKGFPPPRHLRPPPPPPHSAPRGDDEDDDDPIANPFAGP